MMIVSEVELEVAPDDKKIDIKYKVGDRVIFTVLFNNPGHEKPGDKITGTVITVFNNAGVPTYRIRLDVLWNKRMDRLCGKPIIVGNVTEGSMALLAEGD